jgi:chemotaxis protein methyltransferase CheR
MAITLLEAAKGFNVDMKILATDISTRVLEKCQTGNYEKEKLSTVSFVIREKYYDQEHDGKTYFFTAKSILKNLVVFKRLNLTNQTFPMKGPFDVIFCRNVMIYFDQMTRKNLVDKMYFLLKPGGYLIVGHSESLTGIVGAFKAVKPSVYYKELLTS